MGAEVTHEPEVETEVVTTVWPFAKTTVVERTEEQVEHAEDLLEEREELTNYDATVDASFPASDPPPSPIGHLGAPR